MLASTTIPEGLQSDFTALWQHWSVLAQQQGINLSAELRLQLPQVWLSSDFVAQACLGEPALLQELQVSGDLLRGYSVDGYSHTLQPQLSGITDEAMLMKRLRHVRRREMVRIIWRDLAGTAPLAETLSDLSQLADACIDQALQKLYAWQCANMGTPMSAEGVPQQLVVLGMGKLGGGELNVSSDVDLIFAYPEEGQTQGGPRTQDNFEFFLRLGQRLIHVLNQPSEDGFVFRVDMRLRPFGESGPLVMNFDGLENYYQTHGREWERYAMIKARVVAGDSARGAELLQRLRPFVYRRYLDYGAYASLRELKGMIEKEVTRKGMEGNVKLGAGGIREIEFIAQVFQLIRGGRDKQLQQRGLFAVLHYLQQQQLLPEYVVTQLCEAYEFLRNTENRIQAFADQQLHTLPTDDHAQLRLAFSMGFPDWQHFNAVLLKHRARVQTHFEQVFAAPQTQHTDSVLQEQVTTLWTSVVSDPEAAHTALSQLGFARSTHVYDRIKALKTGHAYLSASARGQERLDRLMPLLIAATLQQADTDVALERSLDVIEAILRRTAYLALLEEHPLALSQLVQLCAASPWISHYLATQPILLDELLDPRNLYAPADKAVLQTLLQQRLSNIDEQDEEQRLDALRQFKHSQVLRVAAADIAGELPLMKVSDHLTWIAEVILVQALEWAWSTLVAKHGSPPGTDLAGQQKGFAIVAYGKLGGLELGYGSDVDVVFLYESTDDEQMTNGTKPVALSVFYARLAQRMMHVLTTLTPAGILYEVDVRLRPDGAAGLLVSSVKAYADYQATKAWTWEHQAVVRARVVAGDAAIAAEFTQIRAAILGRPRKHAALRQEVRVMRNKMREALDKTKPGEFDLKHSPGGIVDIEFMVQYGILAWAHAHPTLLTYTDNIRQLQGLADAGVMSQADAQTLAETYRVYRNRIHRLKLQEQSVLVPEVEVASLSEGVKRIWAAWMERDEIK